MLVLLRIASVTVVFGAFDELEMFSFTAETKLSILEFPVLELFVVVFFVEELEVICCVKACAPALLLLLSLEDLLELLVDELEELVLFVVVVLFEP